MNDTVVHEVAEWGSLLIDDARLSDADRRLVASLGQEQTARVVVDELATGVRLRARAWVGVLRFDEFEVRIVPKLAGENLGLVRLLEFTGGIGALRRLPGRRRLEVEGFSLFDLTASLLLDEAEMLIRAGLLADYHEYEEALPMLRGRLLAKEQILRRHGLLDRLHCRYEDRSHNVLDNQIVGAATEHVSRRTRNPELLRRSRSLVELLFDVCDWRAFDAADAQATVTYGRLNDHYRVAHDLAWLVLASKGIEDVFSVGDVHSFAFLLNMNTLFERFVEKVIAISLGAEWVVEPQRSRSIVWHVERWRPYSVVRPDLVVARRGDRRSRLAIDAKYKLYDERRVEVGDVAQAFLYAYSHSETGSDAPRAFLCYPSSTGELETQTLEVRRIDKLAAATVVAVGLPIPDVMNECAVGDGKILSYVRDAVGGLAADSLPVAV